MTSKQGQRDQNKSKASPSPMIKIDELDTAATTAKKSNRSRRGSFTVKPFDIARLNQESKEMITPEKLLDPQRRSRRYETTIHSATKTRSFPKLTHQAFSQESRAARYQQILEKVNQQSIQKVKKPTKPYLKRPVSRENLQKSQRYTSRSFKITSLPKIVYQIAAVQENGQTDGFPKEENTDEFVVINDFAGVKNQYLVAIFDGHGEHGAHLSKAMKEKLPNYIEQNMSRSLQYSTGLPIKSDEALYMREAMLLGYKRTAIDLRRQFRSYMENSGTTCTVIMIRGNLAITVHVGDSVAELISKKYEWAATTLAAPHIPAVHLEKERIQEAGGLISGEDPLIYIPETDPPAPGLRITRVIGNLAAREIGITQRPDVNETYFSQSEKLILLATNGFWSLVNEDEVIKVAAKYWRMGSSNGLVSKLLEYAQEEAQQTGVIDTDSMTIIALFLNHN